MDQGSQSSEQSNAKNHSGTRGFSAPSTEIPRGLRTHRLAPRIIAAIVIAAWAVVFWKNTEAIVKRDEQPTTVFDKFLSIEPSFWTIRSQSKPDICLGVLKTQVIGEENTRFELSGSMAAKTSLKKDATAKIIAFELTGKFTRFNQLQDLSAMLTAGELNYNITSDKMRPRKLAVEWTRDSKDHRIEFERPDPIFLSKRTDSGFTIHLPQSISLLLKNSAAEQALSGKFTDLGLLASSEAANASCLTSIDTVSDTELFPTLALDDFFRMMEK